MPSIVIRLSPSKLVDPDLDLRYEIPGLLAERTGGLVSDGGYDYESGSGDGDADADADAKAMLIFLSTFDVERALPHVIALLESERLHGNNLGEAAEIGVSEREPDNSDAFRIVYPPGAKGEIRPPP